MAKLPEFSVFCKVCARENKKKCWHRMRGGIPTTWKCLDCGAGYTCRSVGRAKQAGGGHACGTGHEVEVKPCSVSLQELQEKYGTHKEKVLVE